MRLKNKIYTIYVGIISFKSIVIKFLFETLTKDEVVSLTSVVMLDRI